MTGVDLFTGNTMKMPAAVIEKKVTMGQLWHNWFWSYSGNFVGSLLLVAAVAASGVLAGSALPVKTALYKSSLTWNQVRRWCAECDRVLGLLLNAYDNRGLYGCISDQHLATFWFSYSALLHFKICLMKSARGNRIGAV